MRVDAYKLVRIRWAMVERPEHTTEPIEHMEEMGISSSPADASKQPNSPLGALAPAVGPIAGAGQNSRRATI